jgi:hypothetical protein
MAFAQMCGHHFMQSSQGPWFESGSAAFVAMVQTADLWEFNRFPQRWRLNRPWNRRILGQSQVSARFVIIFKIQFQDAP